ncbi:aminoglycoside phosphotransferase family protein [Oceanomicrobium pacificus]|uniref:Phosphotransferase n=1 Tax=Oceanomicrobium pacificus TaxID=2692916 RepID=A0A6B0TUX3_9RHOB|nr:phosphotransferase [Oceanomicrobium pacificus]MXU64743.1 phosphotransferase [Oceanomicrobium pacificus]
MDRMAAQSRFLSKAGWSGTTVDPMTGDASTRRYARLSDGHRRAILMDCPPQDGIAADLRPFLAVGQWLGQTGWSVPAPLVVDPDNGFLLLEDLGDALVARVAVDPAIEAASYSRAIDLLAALQDRPCPVDLPLPDLPGLDAAPAYRLPPYDMATYRREWRLVFDWYLDPEDGGSTGDRDALDAALSDLVAERAARPPVLIYRDYHAENLIWLPDRSELAAVGLLDYQDALAGHPAYDLVSLLEDARRDLSPGLRDRMIRRYLDRSGRSEADVLADMAVLGLQRNLKILGLFARLSTRDGKAGYLSKMPRVWTHIETDLAHPVLRDLAPRVRALIPPPDAKRQDRIRARRRVAEAG